MGLTFTDAYEQIKALENSGQITLPEPQETVEVGLIDPQAGTFTLSVPTLVQTITVPPPPGSRTNTIVSLTGGVVATKAVDLRLKFAVVPQEPTNHPAGMSKGVPTRQAADTLVDTGGEAPLETNGGVTLTGFPTVYSAADQITIDVAQACSVVLPNAVTLSPPVSRFRVTINIPEHETVYADFFILRPPVLGMGAFTIPALPMTIVYAPPQGKLLKNTATYSDTETISRTVSSSVTTSNNTKTVQAYTAADLIGKVASAITTVAAVVGTGGAGAGGGASVAGALSELSAALFGPIKDENDSTADATKQVSSEFTLVSNILTAVDASASPTESGTVTTEDDHSLTFTVSTMSQWGAEAGLGPGVGDRVVYMRNVRVVWMALNGEVDIHVLGFDAFGANAAQDLLAEQQAMASGGPSTLGFDADTIKSLLGLDPFVPPEQPVVVHLGPPVIGLPRFVPASPPGRSGSGTGTSGDVFVASFDSATDDKQTTTSSQTTITDAKPGWISVLFGEENIETSTTATFTTSQATDDKVDDKITSTIALFSQGLADPYDVRLFYDRTFGTYAIVDSSSPLLQGGVVAPAGTNTSAIAQTFGQAVRMVRLERGDTVEQVAHRIPTMEARYLAEIEDGLHAPTIVTIKRIASALDLTVSALVRRLN